MAKGKDPAFLFYPGSASEDTQFMNRLERGAYFDLLKAQKKFQKFTLLLVKKVLGSDFEACWPAIESVLEKDGELYFIGWVNDAIENRKEHSAKQKKRIQDYWDKKNSESIPEAFHGNSTVVPLENESKNINENAIVINYKEKESKEILAETDIPLDETLSDVEMWTKRVLEGNDVLFLNMVRGSSVILNGQLDRLARDHLGLCARYNWHEKLTTQQAFRHSLLKHITEQIDKKQSSTTQKETVADRKRKFEQS